MASIIPESGPGKGTHISLIPNKATKIGRDPKCQVVVDDPAASGNHAEITRVANQWQLSDLGSSNGTEMNGALITAPHILTTGDTIGIGQLRFIFLDDEDLAAAAAEPEAEPVARVKPPEPKEAPKRQPPPRYIPDMVEASEEDVRMVEAMRDKTDAIRKELGKVVIGQHKVLEQIMMCILANGHALLVGLPGLAKTTIVRAIGEVLDLGFKRIQFTPDLMPTDITGTEVLETNRDTNEKEFRFIHGPIFCNIMLADEINRTPPKTQAALLEAMQEHMVTVGNETYKLDNPFFVLATQNPIEQEGTYPLPEAQMDRFMFNIWVDYPDEDEEEVIVGTTTSKKTPVLTPILNQEEVLQLQRVVSTVPVSPHVIKYAIRLVRSSRPKDVRALDFIKDYVSIGAGPRAGQYLVFAAKARAVLEGRIHVSCNDIRHAANPVLRHRIATNFAADSEGLTPDDIIVKLLEAVEEPSERDYA